MFRKYNMFFRNFSTFPTPFYESFFLKIHHGSDVVGPHSSAVDDVLSFYVSVGGLDIHYASPAQPSCFGFNVSHGDTFQHLLKREKWCHSELYCVSNGKLLWHQLLWPTSSRPGRVRWEQWSHHRDYRACRKHR